MWIVQLALRRPYTFVVAAILLLLLTPFILMRMATDIFPVIDIPVVSVVYQYSGLDAKEVEQRIVYIAERSLPTLVNNVEHIESNSYNGLGVIKVFLQPGTSVDAGVAQVTAICQTLLRIMPPGQTPPLVITYSASMVPVFQYSFSSRKLSEQELFDFAQNQIRVGLSVVPGASVPWPYGGKMRLVSVDLNLTALKAKNLSAQDVVEAINAQNLVLPGGSAKIGDTEYNIELNSSPRVLEELNDLPVKTIGDATIYLRDVAHVRDGYSPQRNIVRQDGIRGALLTVYKSGVASTLEVVRGVKAVMPRILSALPPEIEVKEFADQSLFVRAAIHDVLRAGTIAATLTALMILLFLGSWRSTFIIALSIPLSVLSSIAALYATGETINLMTLGGLALAVGVLVDDATVTIENIHRHMTAGIAVEDAILIGSREIAMPALVSTLCICIVFVPMFFLTGVAKHLFVPLAKAVVFAMLASYFLSRTLVPTLVMWLYRGVKLHGTHADHHHAPPWVRPFMRIQLRFERSFLHFRERYRAILATCLEKRGAFGSCFLLFCIASWPLVTQLGENFFPDVDAGTFQLHLRARSGTRIEETARLVDQVEAVIREVVPAKELHGVLDNIGISTSGINLTYSNSGVIGVSDADILVSLKPGHAPTDGYVRRLRARLNREFPGTLFYFLPADIVSQTLNFGLPAPFDVQIAGRDQAANRRIAAALAEKIRHVPGAVDVRVHQPADLPTLRIAVDRTKAADVGLTERDAANAVLVSLSGTGQVQPTYWLNRSNGIQYLVNFRVPEHAISSLDELQALPVGTAHPGQGGGQILANLASLDRAAVVPVASHYDTAPVTDVFGGVSGRDLGSVLRDIQPLVEEAKKDLPRGHYITLRGQADTMRTSYIGLGVGLLMAIALIYLLLVVNFQSWLDPFIIITALPGALAGVIWGLFLSQTTLSVPALMGAIMSLGVATANSVLVVSFARAMLHRGLDPITAALESGAGRIRPVLMTALAMVIGMLPMSLGIGEGGEQNAPLGRAVIGGLIVATVATLLFVPAVFSFMHRRATATPHENEPASPPTPTVANSPSSV
jgi:multidrug efflux pump subunit AcrB